MKRITIILSCILFLLSTTACIPHKRINKLNKMRLDGINIPRQTRDELFKNYTFYRADESFGVSSISDSLYIDGEGNFYFYYDSYCQFKHRIIVMPKKDKIDVKHISKRSKDKDMEKITKLPLIYLEYEGVKAFSIDKALALNARIKEMHWEKKCTGIGDIEFELIQAKNLFYLLSILQPDDKKELMKHISDEQLLVALEKGFEDIEEIVKSARADSMFAEKIYILTQISKNIATKLKSMSTDEKEQFISRIDDPEYAHLVSGIVKKD